MLKAISPKVIKPSKPKFMISGKSGVGKTFFALSWPSPYLIDVEGGAVRSQYREKLIKSGGSYFGKEQGSQDFNSVIQEIRTLATTKHSYRTLIIDSFSALYIMAAAIAEEKVGNSFGRDKKEANRPTRQLMRWLEGTDMNIILICHSKDKWERKSNGEVLNVGTTFDGYDKMEYTLDLWCELVKKSNKRSYIVKKSRIDSFPEEQQFPLDYKAFAEIYGEDVIEKESTPIELASENQIKEINELLQIVKIDEETVGKWLSKADCSDWSEMDSKTIQKCIDHVRKKMKEFDK